jgi:hypothetical protein
MVGATYLLFHSPTDVRFRSLFNPYSYNGDALQHIAPLWKIHDSARLAHDYIAQYYVQAIMPVFYKATYWVLTYLVTPPLASKLITLLLTILFIAVTTRTTWLLAGPAAALVALALSWGGALKGLYFLGGLQRGFGVLLGALLLQSIATGHPLGLALLTILAAGFYPATAVLGLAALGLLLVVPSRYRGVASSWSLQKRGGTLLVTALLVGLVVAPQLQGGSYYGERLSIESEREFPEWGPSGRYTQGDRGVPVPFLEAVYARTLASLSAKKISLQAIQDGDEQDLPSHYQFRCDVILLLSAGCLAVLFAHKRRRVSPEAVRVALFTLAIFLSFEAATLLFPILYIPSRYVIVGIPSLVPVLFPWVWSATAETVLRRCSQIIRTAASIFLSGLCCAALGWTTLQVKPIRSAEGYRHLFSFIERLPEDTVIAGWPRGVIDEIPFFTGKSVLIFEEGHQIFHRDFLLEMRRRMQAIMEVYTATDAQPFEALQKTFHVTHLLVDRRHVDKSPAYFAPFDAQVSTARARHGDQPLFLAKVIEKGGVIRVGEMVLVDLSRITQPTGLP